MAGSFGYEAEPPRRSRWRWPRLSLLPAVRKAPDAIVVADGTSCRQQIADGAGREALHVARVLVRPPGLRRSSGADVGFRGRARRGRRPTNRTIPRRPSRTRMMNRLLLAAAAGAVLLRRGVGRVPRQADHDRRARSPPAGRPTRSRATSPRRCASRWQPDASSSTTSAAPAARSAPPRSRTAAPDGYTLLLHHIGMATSPALYRKMPYKTLDDFEYLGMINDVPMTLIGKPSLPANNYAELTQVARGQQGQDQSRQRRPRRRLAPVRPAVPEHAQDRHADGAVQGHRRRR